VAKIDEFSDIVDSTELNFQIVGSFFSERNILKIKWVPSANDHIALLREDNHFMIYDFGNNIDEPEINLDLNYLDPKKKLIAEIPPMFEDFSFSNNKDGYDCAMFSVFFMNNYGEIYYKCPLIINGLVVPKRVLAFLKKRINHEKQANIAEKELIERIQGFIKSIEEFSIEEDDNYQINSSKIPPNINVNDGVIQGFI
jgi:hypothetical protein